MPRRLDEIVRFLMKPMVWATLCAILLPSAGRISGQETDPGRIQGRVLDDVRGKPVPGALVYLKEGPHAKTDGDGAFLFEEVAAGRYDIAAVGPDCATAVGVVSVEPARTLAVDLRIVPLATAAAQVPERGWDPAPSQTGAQVQVITAEEIRRSSATDLLALVRSRVPGVVGEVSGASDAVGRLRGRGNNTVTQSTEPVVVIDGARIQRRAAEALSQIGPHQVTRIEIYRGSAGAWIHGFGSANGVIRVFTVSSGLHAGTRLDPKQCGDPFQGG